MLTNRVCVFYIKSKYQRQELLKATTPCEPFVTSALRDVSSVFDTCLIEGWKEGRAEVFVGTIAHEESLYLAVELGYILESSAIEVFELGAWHEEYGSAERTYISESVEMSERDVEGLLSTP